ncbi:MAG: glycine--tRNA ligase [Candidatus Heimdallarchaeaceae archaeon]
MSVTMEQIVSLCKRRGFIFPGSEIYGGLANTWDYGPLGVELKNNIKQYWWKKFVTDRNDMVGLDSAILMNPKVWQASGHLDNFSDPLTDCKKCKNRFRVDKLLEEKIVEQVEGKTFDELKELMKTHDIKCTECGAQDFTDIRSFNLMFKTHQGVTDESATEIYMRPETAQGIFVNFKNVLQTTRKKLPFGIGQIGKAFRNEITPGNFTFRTREFEQMEIEYFVEPGQEKDSFEAWQKELKIFFKDIGVKEENLRFREHDPEELSHYSSATTDIEYKYPWGFGELTGLAIRTDFDLKRHMEFSGENFEYTDPYDNKRKFVPYVIEPSFGCDRTVLTVLLDAYKEEELEDGSTRVVMKFDKKIAPIQVAILPLKKNEDRIVKKSKEVQDLLSSNFSAQYDDTASIGKLYRRQDEIGTPYCVTIDFDTIEKDEAVTVRDRDTMKQERVLIKDLKTYFFERLI